jgi:hypothetical protein
MKTAKADIGPASLVTVSLPRRLWVTRSLDYLASGDLFGLIYTPYCWGDLRLA